MGILDNLLGQVQQFAKTDGGKQLIQEAEQAAGIEQGVPDDIKALLQDCYEFLRQNEPYDGNERLRLCHDLEQVLYPDGADGDTAKITE